MAGLTIKLCCLVLLFGIVLSVPSYLRRSSYTNGGKPPYNKEEPDTGDDYKDTNPDDGDAYTARTTSYRADSAEKDATKDVSQHEMKNYKTSTDKSDEMEKKTDGDEHITGKVKDHIKDIMHKMGGEMPDGFLEHMMNKSGKHWDSTMNSWEKPILEMMKKMGMYGSNTTDEMLANISGVAKHMMEGESWLKDMYKRGQKGFMKLDRHQMHSSNIMIHMLKALVCKVDEMGARMVAMQAQQDYMYQRMKDLSFNKPMHHKGMKFDLKQMSALEITQLKKELEYMEHLHKLKKIDKHDSDDRFDRDSEDKTQKDSWEDKNDNSDRDDSDQYFVDHSEEFDRDESDRSDRRSYQKSYEDDESMPDSNGDQPFDSNELMPPNGPPPPDRKSSKNNNYNDHHKQKEEKPYAGATFDRPGSNKQQHQRPPWVNRG